MNQQNATVPVLEYGRQPRRYARKIIVAIVVLIVLYVAARVGWNYAQPYCADWQYWHRLDQLVKSQPSPETIFYSDDPAKLAALTTDPDYTPINSDAYDYSALGITKHWLPAPGFSRSGVGFFYPTAGFRLIKSVYCWRNSADGTKFLIQLANGDVTGIQNDDRLVRLMEVTFANPPPPRQLGQLMTGRVASYAEFRLGKDEHLTIWAPQVDPRNSSVIWFKYEVNGQVGKVQCTVTNNGGVYFKSIEGPKQLGQVQ